MKTLAFAITPDLDYFNLRLPKFGFNTLVDMLIVAFIAYKILVWVEQTRAWTLFKGIFFLAFVYFLSEAFKLYTIKWIISNSLTEGLIALVVIFQPEIRKALEQIGKGTLSGKLTGNPDADSLTQSTIEEIITACRKMSKDRTGALIVIENQVKLGDLEETGTVLDAIVTHQLLISIFEDKMPLHDGAVILRKNRVAAAGCILPLTKKDISSELGTRHRAAVGVSEVSDADTLVVSNETGQISLSKDGRLFRNLSDADIRNMLINKKSPPLSKLQSFIKKEITKPRNSEKKDKATVNNDENKSRGAKK